MYLGTVCVLSPVASDGGRRLGNFITGFRSSLSFKLFSKHPEPVSSNPSKLSTVKFGRLNCLLNICP